MAPRQRLYLYSRFRSFREKSMKKVFKVLAIATVLNLIISGPSAIADTKRAKRTAIKVAPVLPKLNSPAAITLTPTLPTNPATCPAPVVLDTATANNGTTILKTVAGTSLISSAYSTIAGTGTHTFAMNPLTSAGGKITFDTTTTRITIDSATAAGTYLETITATAADTASVTTVINVTITVTLPVITPVLDTKTAQICANIAHELNEVNEVHESETNEHHSSQGLQANGFEARPSINQEPSRNISSGSRGSRGEGRSKNENRGERD